MKIFYLKGKYETPHLPPVIISIKSKLAASLSHLFIIYLTHTSSFWSELHCK